jgi:Short C-terminal domain
MIGGAGYRAGCGAVPPATGGRVDLVSKLQDLKTLMDQGVLTTDEFQAAKRKLLAG